MKTAPPGTVVSVQQDLLLEKILKAYTPEKLYLLGLTRVQQNTETIFSEGELQSQWTAHYYVLALVKKEAADSLNSIQDKIESCMQQIMPVTAIVLDWKEFERWLAAGHPFASAVQVKAKLLYSTEAVYDSSIIAREQQKQNDESVIKNAKLRMEEFLAGAELYRVRNQNRLAAFMLHQATEQALVAMFMIHTGLRVNTHSIDKLVRYCSMFNNEVPDIFSKNNEGNRRLFHLLQSAYINARYRDDYHIPQQDLKELMEKARKLQSVFERYVEKYIKSFDAR